MLPWRYRLCFWLSWHKIIFRYKLSRDSEYLRCSCGKDFAMNHHVRVILPWYEMENFYCD